jgi:hypothetical protein
VEELSLMGFQFPPSLSPPLPYPSTRAKKRIMEPTKNYKKIAIKITEVASKGEREIRGRGIRGRASWDLIVGRG